MNYFTPPAPPGHPPLSGVGKNNNPTPERRGQGEVKQCKHCSKTFQIDTADLDFYQRIGVPQPTLCPDCRCQRRMALRNERNFYPDICQRCKKPVVSQYHPAAGYTVYCNTCFNGDNWEPQDYAQTIDWQKPFFKQFAELQKRVPRPSIMNSGGNIVNSDYCSYEGDAKDSYLCFGSIHIEDCYYGNPYYSKQCVDSLLIRDCELCYQCITSEGLYHSIYCQDCFNSRDLMFCYDVQTSADCIGSAGLRNAQYQIYNQQHTEAEYKRFLSQLNLQDAKQLTEIQTKFSKVKLKIPHKYSMGLQNEDVTGNYINHSHGLRYCYDVRGCEHTRYSAQVMDLKDCQDCNYTEENELCYDYIGSWKNYHCLFSATVYNSKNVYYSELCQSSQDLFGCIGVRKGQYMILNQRYTEAEYKQLSKRLMEQMTRAGEFGEFFPIEQSPFPYNATVAFDYFPLSKAQIQQNGWQWADAPAPTNGTGNAIVCQQCQKSFRCIPPEMKFYEQMHLAKPSLCPSCRHLQRMAMRPPRALWHRQCMCVQPEHNHVNGRCTTEFETSYSPDTKELVYCEQCYNKEII